MLPLYSVKFTLHREVGKSGNKPMMLDINGHSTSTIIYNADLIYFVVYFSRLSRL